MVSHFDPPSIQSPFVGLDTICVPDARHEQHTFQGRIWWLLWLRERITLNASKHIFEESIKMGHHTPPSSQVPKSPNHVYFLIPSPLQGPKSFRMFNKS